MKLSPILFIFFLLVGLSVAGTQSQRGCKPPKPKPSPSPIASPSPTPTPVVLPSPTPAPTQASDLTVEQIVTGADGEDYAHATVFTHGKLFVGTGNFPAKILRFNNPRTDLWDYSVLTFPDDGNHKQSGWISYSPTTDRIYVLHSSSSGQIAVSEVSPDLAYRDLIQDTVGGYTGHCLTEHDGYLYICAAVNTQSDVRILRYDALTGIREADSGPFTGRVFAHGIQVSNSNVFVTSGYQGSFFNPFAPAWVAKLPLDLSSVTFQTLGQNITDFADDFAIRDGYLWISNESGPAIGTIIKVSADLSTFTYVQPNVVANSVYNALGYVWLADSAGYFARINPITNEVRVWAMPAGFKADEIVTDGALFYIVARGSPVRVARVSIQSSGSAGFQ